MVTKQTIERNWKVAIHAKNIRVLNASRRYHVFGISILILVLIAAVPKQVKSVELRVYIVDWAFIAAIAIGESIELCMFAWLRGWPFDLAKANEEGIAVILLRQPLTLKNSGNIQRVVCFVFKIFVCVILKTSVQDSAWLYPSLSVFD